MRKHFHELYLFGKICSLSVFPFHHTIISYQALLLTQYSWPFFWHLRYKSVEFMVHVSLIEWQIRFCHGILTTLKTVLNLELFFTVLNVFVFYLTLIIQQSSLMRISASNGRVARRLLHKPLRHKYLWSPWSFIDSDQNVILPTVGHYFTASCFRLTCTLTYSSQFLNYVSNSIFLKQQIL